MPTNFVIGHIFIWLARREVRAAKTVWNRPLFLSWLYAAAVFVPATGYYYYAHTGWSTVYLRPEEAIPAWFGPVILSFYFLGMVFGTLLAQFWIRSGLEKFWWLTLLLGVYWYGATWAMTWDEYFHIGTYAQYHAGQAIALKDAPDFTKELNVMGAILAVPGVAIAVFLSRAGARFKTA